MALITPVLIIFAALAALYATPADQPILGLTHAAFASVAGLAAVASWLAIPLARRLRFGDLARAVLSAATWALLVVALTGVYAYRFELVEIGSRVIGELLPNEPTIGRGGEVIIAQRLDGSYVVPAKVNGRSVSLIFDTGATSVVLTAEDAARAGINLGELDFSTDVVTANGAAVAAPVKLDRISVGPIVVTDVRALVARRGALVQSLLGMTFLERLESYAVARGKLALKGR